MKKLFVVIVLVLAFTALSAQKKDSANWEFLSTSTIGAGEFVAKHPAYDGRGVIIAVCDSGVDLGLAGLDRTTTGENKMIDARDFSGQYAFKAEKAEVSKDDGSIYSGGGKRLFGWEKALPGANSKDLFVGYFDEDSAKNSEVKDLNGNGAENDIFGFILYEDKAGSKPEWKVLLDRDGNGSLEGEQPLSDYSTGRKYFQLEGRDRHSGYLPMNLAVNIDAEKKEVAFYAADGSHGTHVAGIAAGCRIDGQEKFNGIAPGACVMGLKIGNNAYSGGATTPGSMISAWRYAVEKAKELDMPLVIQMSYGIGAEDEGMSKAEELIDQLLADNPEVCATVSNGNEGPQISTAGLPSCASNVLSIGAVLARTTAKDLYGANLAQDELFSFSSRGGEYNKPDFVCPGFAAATVPLWEEGKNVMRGTSMAAPQAAGAVALVLSAAKAERLPIRRDILNAALRRSAKEIPGYNILDQGWGLVNIERALEIYRSLAKRENPVLSFKVETKSPEMATGKGPAVFYRGAFYPKGADRQEITVSPVFPKDYSKEKQVKFFEAFDLSSEGGFFSLAQGSCYMKAEEPAKIYVNFNRSALQKPGLYSGKIKLFLKGTDGSLGPEWMIPVTVVVPFEADAKTGAFPKVDGSVGKAKVNRSFFRVGADSAGASFKVAIENDPDGRVYFYFADPEGRERDFAVLSREHREEVITLSPPFEKGVYEIVLYGNYLNTGDVSFTIEALDSPVKACLPSPLKISAGAPSKAKLILTSKRSDSLKATLSAEITGSLSEKNEKVSGSEFTRPFQIGPGDEMVAFKLEMSSSDFGKFTDIAVEVLDEDGKSLYADGMSQRFLTLAVGEEEGLRPGEKYNLRVLAATADPDDEPSWNLCVKEYHLYKDKIAADMGKNGSVELYPDREKEVSLSFGTPPPAIPENSSYLLSLTVAEKKDKGFVHTVKMPLPSK
ncbi:MAG TPA: S8 family serine peptidase [Acidobacteriota bacterium]|nr:S8 family serine peptidase [Acidobacteriota bacterium]HNT17048.1 S8 family serine peptidase [Acidobacteriota bacterium]